MLVFFFRFNWAYQCETVLPVLLPITLSLNWGDLLLLTNLKDRIARILACTVGSNQGLVLRLNSALWLVWIPANSFRRAL